MPRITVEDFRFSHRAASKMREHGIDFDRLFEILEHRHIVMRNWKGRAADYFVIGRDNSGRCIAVPILPTEDPLSWRPVTAWPCKPNEAAALGS